LAEAQRLAHVGGWDWDLRSNTVTWSEELYRIFGLPTGQIKVAGDAMSFIHPEDRDLVRSTLESAVRNKKPYSFHYRVLRPDGEERIVHSRSSVLCDNHGEPIRIFGATQDVTELKRAEERLKETSEQLRSLSARLQSAREEESKRIAREIHDELGGALTTWKWDLEEICDVISEPLDSSQVAALRTKVEAMTKLTETTLDTVRKLASELRPAALELGLVEGIEWQILQFESRTGIEVRLESSVEKVDLDDGQAIAVFRILQEALTNIQRHAQATKATITVNQVSGQFLLMIQDNGTGFTKGQEIDRQSLGLLGMRERVHLVGGEINIESAAGEGTKITVQVPLVDSGRLRPVLQSDS
jgi:PAS domain S-box-containing protein